MFVKVVLFSWVASCMDIYQGLLESLKNSVRSSQVPLVSNPGLAAVWRLRGGLFVLRPPPHPALAEGRVG